MRPHRDGVPGASFTTHQHAQVKLTPSVKVEHLAHVTAASQPMVKFGTQDTGPAYIRRGERGYSTQTAVCSVLPRWPFNVNVPNSHEW